MNSAPIASGTTVLLATAEDTASPPGATVTALFGANFSDAADGNALAGAAVVGNTTPATEGVWRYSLDGGTSWTALPAGLSDSNALVLSATARLDFLPAAKFNGAPPPLQVHLIDSSTDVPVSGTTTGAALGASTQAIAGVDVSGTHQGGTTAVSAATVALSTAVTAVNDAPIASGTAQLPDSTKNTVTPPTATVGTLFAANFADTADAQASGANPTGSAANTLAGVALVGNATLPTQGTWRYSLDGGTSYTNVPAGLSDLNALLLPATARLEFVPGTDFVGMPLPLTARLIDSSTQVPLFGTFTGADLAGSTQAIAGVDVSGTHQGGATAVSAASVPLSVTINFANVPPTIGGVAPAPIAIGDNATTHPFSTVTISDPDFGATETVTITTTDANGTLAGAGLSKTGAGTYTLAAGTPGAVSAALRAVVFTPTANQVAPGSTVTTGFTLSVTDGTATASDATTRVVATSINDAPVLSGDRTITVAQGGTTPITLARLSATDPDNTDTQIVYSVTGTTHGAVLVNGVGAMSFTQADLAAGRVDFRQDGSATTSAGFTASVTDGIAAGQTVSVTASTLISNPGTPTPTPTLKLSGVSGQPNYEAGHVLSGSIDVADAGSRITIRDGSTILGTTTASSSGAFTLAFNDVKDGPTHSYSLTASAVGTAGATGTSDTLVFTFDYTPNQPLFGTVVTSSATQTGSIYGLYEGLLHRAPDALGLEAFTTALQTGASLTDVAGAILASPERGGQPANFTSYVTGLYTNLLHRAPDSGGLSFFTGELNAGVSQATVAVQLATSQEAQNVNTPAFQTGVFVPDSIDSAVARLYYGVLNRAPDANGLAAFEGQVKQAAGGGGGVAGAVQSLAQVANAMLASPEYANAHAGQTDTAFVSGLYQGALGRVPEAAGASFYAQELAQGVSRATVALQIAESPEAQVHLVGVVEQGFHLAG